MATEVKRGKEWFTVPEAAKILGINKQSIYDAVKDGRLRATGEGWGRRIHAEDILAYGIRTGKDPELVIQQIKDRREVSLKQILAWILAGLGIAWLLTELFKEG
jgi:excisionase family DNA binding protein